MVVRGVTVPVVARVGAAPAPLTTSTYVGKEGYQPILLPPSFQASWRTR